MNPPFSHRLSRRNFFYVAASGAVAAVCPAGASEDSRPEATARLNAWLENRFDGWVARSPMQQGFLGLGTNLNQWDDISETRYLEDVARAQNELRDLRANFTPETFTGEGQLSYRLFELESEQRILDSEWRYHAYPVNQMFGWQQRLPSFLINIHRIESTADAMAYIERLRGIDAIVEQVLSWMRIGQEADVLAPKFAYVAVLRDCRNIIAGAPFAGGGLSPLWSDFSRKIRALDVEETTKQNLLPGAEQALLQVVGPAFQKLIEECEQQLAFATTDDGVWKLPNGEEYYAHLLRRHTSGEMTANEIHEFGLEDVARIHDEMRELMRAMNISGDLKSFFARLKTDSTFYYPQSDAGKAAYLARTRDIVEEMSGRLDKMFSSRPRTPLRIEPIEPYREQSAAAAFYQGPGAYDGRPATYYINTFDMGALPKYEMEALAYHETIPGHHLQIAMVQEADHLPSFRRFSSRYTAYTEGWSLYCEQLAKEMGLYQDLYSDFGRLTSELWRACRLVVDTGIHSPNRKWTREVAITYLRENTPNTERDITNSVERYIVQPGQAVAYKVGMANIQSLRSEAETTLGAKFDIKAFHDVILGSGAVPLNILAENVRAWIGDTQEG